MEENKDLIKRDEAGRFVPGQSGNPLGINAGRPPQKELEEALLEAQYKHDKTLMAHLVERAYKSDSVLVALAKKLLPDKVEAEIKAPIVKMDNIRIDGVDMVFDIGGGHQGPA